MLQLRCVTFALPAADHACSGALLGGKETG
jgi:hypothetical protein